MDRNLGIRFIIILIAVGLAAWVVYPPGENIRLGLDLQGGMHLVLQVETEDALNIKTQKDLDQLLQELEEQGVDDPEILSSEPGSIAVGGVPAAVADTIENDDDNRFLFEGYDFDHSGSTLRLEMTTQARNEVRELSVRQALETIRNRIDAFGVSEPVVHREGVGGNRIVIQLPGVDDPERVKGLIKNTALLEFSFVYRDTDPAPTRDQLLATLGGSVPPDAEILPQVLRDDEKNPVGEQWWAIEKRRVIYGEDLKTARPSTGQFNEPAVNFILTREGAQKFGDATGANIGRNLAIILDSKVVSAPVIEDRITNSGIIRGSFTQQEVQDLSTVLRSGALPAGLTYLEERTVGPSLGQDSIEKGKKAGLIGLGLVILTMFIVYKLTGTNAVLALILNIVLVFGALSLFDATLTLPGIAGIVLTVGMAVDANVLIFERIREELRAGRTVKSAIVAGFSKALSSVLDANFTTLIAAAFLFMFGTGPIRGFAVTLSVGIVASLFTAIFISRWLFDLATSRRQRVEKMSI